MIHPKYKYIRNHQHQTPTAPSVSVRHSAKGSTWEEHKYIKRLNGTYYYPDNYEGGRHLPDSEKDSTSTKEKDAEDNDTETTKKESEASNESIELTSNDIENLAKEVIRGNFGNGQVRKDLLGDNYAEVQKRVNEMLAGSSGSKKVSEVSKSSIVKAAEAAAKVANTVVTKTKAEIDMSKVLSVYAKDKLKKKK